MRCTPHAAILLGRHAHATPAPSFRVKQSMLMRRHDGERATVGFRLHAYYFDAAELLFCHFCARTPEGAPMLRMIEPAVSSTSSLAALTVFR